MLKMMIKPVRKDFYLNPIAQLYLLATQLIKVLIAGRGFGKSFVNGISIIIKVATMPRSRGLFIGLTYTQILSNTLLPMKSAWEWFGYKEGVDYVVGKKPPPHFDKPYQKPDRYENVITFWNGTTVILGSFDRPQLLRGGSNDWSIVDESLLINKAKYDQIVVPSIRGSHILLNDKPGHLGHEFTSSMPYGNMGSWMFEYEQLAKNPENDTFYIEGTSWHNRVILTDKVLNMWKRQMSPVLYQIEVMNKRIRQFGNIFYPALNDKHFYSPEFEYDNIDSLYDEIHIEDLTAFKRDSRFDKDCDPMLPLNLSFDFGAFNCLLVDQERKDRSLVTDVYFLNYMYVIHPDIIDDLVDKFDDYYQHHQNKILFLWGDKSGNKREGNSKDTYFQQIQNRLEKKPKCWRVILKQTGDVEHIERHRFINTMLKEEDRRLPKIHINQANCKDFRIALESAGMRGIKKDKRSEDPKTGVKPQHATHPTDAFDYRLYHAFHHLESLRSYAGPVTPVSFGAGR